MAAIGRDQSALLSLHVGDDQEIHDASTICDVATQVEAQAQRTRDQIGRVGGALLAYVLAVGIFVRVYRRLGQGSSQPPPPEGHPPDERSARTAKTTVQLLLAAIILHLHWTGAAGCTDPLLTAGNYHPGTLALHACVFVSGYASAFSIRSRADRRDAGSGGGRARAAQAARFLWRRARSIATTVWWSAAVTAGVLGPLFSSAGAHAYWAGARDFVALNAIAPFHVFEFWRLQNLWSPAASLPGIGGSTTSLLVWSLPYQAACYAMLALLHGTVGGVVAGPDGATAVAAALAFAAAAIHSAVPGAALFFAFFAGVCVSNFSLEQRPGLWELPTLAALSPLVAHYVYAGHTPLSVVLVAPATGWAALRLMRAEALRRFEARVGTRLLGHVLISVIFFREILAQGIGGRVAATPAVGPGRACHALVVLPMAAAAGAGALRLAAAAAWHRIIAWAMRGRGAHDKID